MVLNAKGNPKTCSLSGQDTIFINSHIAYFGEYGSVDEGLIIFDDTGILKARYVKYNSSSQPLFKLDKHSVVEYYSKIKNDYFVIKNDWALDSLQVISINALISDFKNYVPDKGVSNAGEFYHLQVDGNDHVIIDRLGNWDKYNDIHRCIHLQVEIPKRLYFMGIKIRSKEVKYGIN